MWVQSPRAVIDNLIVGHEAPASSFTYTRSINVPGISVAVGDMVSALREVAGDDVAARVKWAYDPAIDRIVSTWPSNFAPKLGPALGMRADADFAGSSAPTSPTTCRADDATTSTAARPSGRRPRDLNSSASRAPSRVRDRDVAGIRIERNGPFAAQHVGALAVRQQPAQPQLAVAEHGVTGDRRVAAAGERARERALRGDREVRRVMHERRDCLDHVGTVDRALDGERALAHGGKEIRGIEERRDAVILLQAVQARGGQDHRVVLPFVELAHARVHVAAQRDAR